MAPKSAIDRRFARRRELTIDALRESGVSRSAMYRALHERIADGRVVRVRRGVYRVARVDTVSDGWSQAMQLYPEGVLCLLSALMFHGLGTQAPREVWLALPKSAWRKSVDWPPLRLLHFSGDAFGHGIEQHRRPEGTLRVYSAAKTVADCFKFRNRIGLDIAIEALREGWRERRFTLEELDAMARVCRVRQVMRPYIEALVA